MLGNNQWSSSSRWAISAAAVLYLTGSEMVPEIFAEREEISNLLQALRKLPNDWAKQICLTEINHDT